VGVRVKVRVGRGLGGGWEGEMWVWFEGGKALNSRN